MSIPLSSSGLQVNITREIVYAVSVQTTMSGIEIRTRWHNTPRYRYRITIIGRTEVQGELAALAAAVTDVSGEWATFSMVDPYDGVTRTVRLEGNTKFAQYKIRGWWEVQYAAISVV